MKTNYREGIALLRHKIISPVLMDSGRGQMEYFRLVAAQEFEVPGRGLRRFKATTMKGLAESVQERRFLGACSEDQKGPRAV